MNGRTTNGTAADIFESAPPRDLESEAALLGSILIDPALMDTAAAPLLPHHFFDQTHSELFAAMRRLRNNGRPVDPVLLHGELVGKLDLDNSAAKAFLMKTGKATTGPANAVYYANQIMQAWRKRKLREAALDAFQGASNGQSIEGIVAALRADIDEFSTVGNFRREPIDIADLIAEFPDLREEIIDGILRRGETANIIAAAKVGKSWLVYGIALSVATGRPWLNRFPCRPGRVLLIDNELHRETIASRIPVVAHEMGLALEDYRGQLLVESLRGGLKDLPRLTHEVFEHRGPGEFDLVILDAWYRAIPEGTSENDNAQIMQLYNLIDRYTAQLDAAWINIHHSSKGEQGGKAIVDVGAGAGSQARAADAHIVLRTHEEPGAAVLDAALRSFRPIDPLPLRFEWPLWSPDEALDPDKLVGKLTKQQEKQAKSDREGIATLRMALKDAPATNRKLRQKTGLSRDRIERLMDMEIASGNVEANDVKANGRQATEYVLLGGVEDSESPTRPPTG